ncbi:hypothetical protein BWQ96_08473 [Gracilariopsis chorda]|uniref:Uncharacterized protein n=1 Tax=Gracilariopsis chorda TaxID=448386 RepID=A0A2V3II80_9FLOR|nr:hypothetical protein BWQ96_08473 [Gracilariopsis chorda]|eukprot:PXF41796.1 hypothetical protein BWQ96_08473 [Gracilariopsis chorda]
MHLDKCDYGLCLYLPKWYWKYLEKYGAGPWPWKGRVEEYKVDGRVVNAGGVEEAVATAATNVGVGATVANVGRRR